MTHGIYNVKTVREQWLDSTGLSQATVANREEGRDSFPARIKTKYCGSVKNQTPLFEKTCYKLKAAVGERMLYAEAPCCYLRTFFNKKGGYSHLGVII